jgi:hypothetical protein
MPNFSVKYQILEANVSDMASEVVKMVINLKARGLPSFAIEMDVAQYMKDWERKHTSLYDTGEI